MSKIHDVGAPPGTLFYNGEQKGDKIKITLIEFNENEFF